MSLFCETMRREVALSEKQVAVIGAGASGLVAAIECARNGAETTLYEAGHRLGTKILKTGNGRCNLSNSAIEPGWDFKGYNNPAFVQEALGELGCAAIRGFFESIGLLTFEDSEGRIYPVTNSAASVVEALAWECRRLRVYIKTDCKVHGVRAANDDDRERLGAQGDWVVTVDDGSEAVFDKVIVATGNSFKVPARLALPIDSKSFVLGPLATSGNATEAMDGVRIRARVTLRSGGKVAFSDTGEVLFRKYGVSGIVIFDCSRYANYGDEISLDLVPFLSEEELAADLETRNERYRMLRQTSKALLAALSGLIHGQAIPAILDYCGVDVDDPPRELPVDDLAFALKNFELTIADLPGADNAQVTRGGVSTEAVDGKTLESLGRPGIYVCGEALDVDGACGGFNLHWAWGSGLVAARSACIS